MCPTWTHPLPSPRSRSSLSSGVGAVAVRRPDGRQRSAELSQDAVTLERDATSSLDVPFYFSVPKTAVTTRGESPPLLVPDGLEPVDRGEGVRSPRHRRQQGARRPPRSAPRAPTWRGSSRRPACSRTATSRSRSAPSSRHPRLPAHPDGRDAREPRLHEGRRGLQRRLPARLGVRRSVQHAALHGRHERFGRRRDGIDALHILRPAGFDAARRAQLQKWASPSRRTARTARSGSSRTTSRRSSRRST